MGGGKRRATLLDQSLGQLRTLAMRDHPAGDVAAEDIQDHVEVGRLDANIVAIE